jgi:hypothetical protein
MTPAAMGTVIDDLSAASDELKTKNYKLRTINWLFIARFVDLPKR